MAIYLLYDCNDWREWSSMRTASPIAVATSKEEFEVMLAKDLDEDAKHLSDDNMSVFLTLEKEGDLYSEDVLSEVYDAYDEQRIEYKHIVVLEEGYNVN
jgi:hypothetical protein